MVKLVAYFLVIISLVASPVFAGQSDLQSPDDSASVAAKADKGKMKGSDSKPAGGHQCCTAHAHYGDSSPTYSHAPSLPSTSNRLPLLAEEFLAAFGPDPLLEPPSHA